MGVFGRVEACGGGEVEERALVGVVVCCCGCDCGRGKRKGGKRKRWGGGEEDYDGRLLFSWLMVKILTD